MLWKNNGFYRFKKYADIAIKYGAEVPFLRSKSTSSDSASSWDVVREVLRVYKKLEKSFDYVALLQPTSPLRDSYDIKRTWEKIKELDYNNAVTVTEVEHPVQWCFRLSNSNSMDEMATSPYSYKRRQELDVYYRENGAVYFVDAKKIMDKKYNFYADKCAAYVMSKEKSIDIDTKMDLIIAEVYMKNKGMV